MSERLTRLSMCAFRGIREELTMDLPGGCGLLVYGDNATGKSTIADALE